MKLSNFASILNRYKAVFFDAFGVLKNYNGVIKGIEHTFDHLAANGMEYFVLTNDSSRSPELLAAKYRDSGIEAINTDHIISSGMLAREYFKQTERRAGGLHGHRKVGLLPGGNGAGRHSHF
ncbi:MAG: hypothetical protein KDD15_31230 [Lewinella sp.]|nr:hypothetical protein [Lewinella sp.]